jgi:ubiquinol-cytochrome c reductase cytochrome c subunit
VTKGLVGVAAAIALLVPSGAAAQSTGDQVQHGRTLFVQGCSTCHGLSAEGTPGVAPSLRGVGAESADFYLSTGRMPLDDPGEQPLSSDPEYSQEEIDALVAYIGSLGGPPVPQPRPEEGKLNDGVRLFSLYCAGCHQVGARGGEVVGAFAPKLTDVTPTQVAEAVRVGPYVMPVFHEQLISDAELNSIIRYVEYAKKPDNRGGWGIGNIGPIPEGAVAWLIGIPILLLIARLIGERQQ